MKKITLLGLLSMSLLLSFQIEAQHFTTTWDTEAGDPGNAKITLPMSGGNYDVDINNDGVFGDVDATSLSMDNRNGITTITFASPGQYTINIRPNPTNNTANELGVAFQGINSRNPQKLLSIESWGTSVWVNMSSAFRSCSNLTISDTAGNPDFSQLTDASFMFNNASSLTADVCGWDVSNITNMQRMFYGATAFNSDLSSWDVSSATNLFDMLAFTSVDITNYDALLTSWSALPSLQSGVSFGAPPTNYCNGETGRNILINTHSWNISGDLGLDCSTLSLDDQIINSIQVYVANNELFVKGVDNVKNVALHNILGQRVQDIPFDKNKNSVALQNLKTGIYIALVTTESGRLSRHKFFVQ